MDKGVLQGTLVIIAGIILLFFLIDRVRDDEPDPNQERIEDSATFKVSYGHYRLEMRNIAKQALELSELRTLNAALEVCQHLPEWTNKSYDAIEFVEEYKPLIEDKGYLEHLEEIEELASLHIATAGRLERYCDDPQMQVLDVLSR